MIRGGRAQTSFLASLKWGEGWSRCPIYFVQTNIVVNHEEHVKTLQSPRKIYPRKTRTSAQEHASKSTSFSGTLSSSLPYSFLGKVHVGNAFACLSSCKRERRNCLRKGLPKTMKDLKGHLFKGQQIFSQRYSNSKKIF